MEGTCYICEKPLTRMVCLEHLARNIERWLPEKHAGSFRTFHRNLLKNFVTCGNLVGQDGCRFSGKMILCESRSMSDLCVYCYMNEVFVWLSALDSELPLKFLQAFSSMGGYTWR